MRKVYFLLLCFTSLFTVKAQPGYLWDSLDYSGFGDVQQRVTAMTNFNGNLYCGVGAGSAGAAIYTTTNARYGSYSLENNFASMHDASDYQVTSMITDAPGNLFVASENSLNGGHVYYCTTSNNWTTLPYPTYTTSPNMYTSVTGLAIFNIGGQDSLYAGCNSSTNNTQIWKCSASNPTGGWVLAYSYAPSTTVKKMLMYNSYIVALFNNSSAVTSVDGVNWAPDNGIGSGFGDANNFVKDLEVFNGELYALCDNSNTGIQIWKTTDLLTWNPVMQDGFTNGNLLTQSSDLHVSYGKLWVSAVVSAFNPINSAPGGGNGNIPTVSGGSMGPIVYSSANGTNYVRESNKLMDNQNNYLYWNLYSFANKTLLYGWNFSRGGGIYSKCQQPVASATVPNDSICQYGSALFTSTSQNDDSLRWFRNGFNYSTGSSWFMPSFSAGTNTVTLIAYNAGCTDTATYLEEVIAPPSLNSVFSFPANVCPGQNFTFGADYSVVVPPLSYQWVGADTLYNDTNTVVITGPLTYTLYVQDGFGCQGNAFPYSYGPPPSYNLGGTVSYSGGPVQGATVFCIKVGASSALYDTVATTLTDAAGAYVFNTLLAGQYLLRVEPDTAGVSPYDNCLATYYGGTYLWDSAFIYQHYCDSNITQANIQLIEITPTLGPGSISGVVYEGIGFGQKMAQGPGNPVIYTNVVPGVPVKVGKNPGGAIVASGMTDTNGQYYFNNLPYDNYRIYTDIPGYPMDSSYVVTLNAGNDSLVNLDYYVDSNSVYIDLTTSVSNNSNNENAAASILLFPNPTNGPLNFVLKSEENSTVTVKLFDLTGKQSVTSSYSGLKGGLNKINIDLSGNGMAKGIYIVEIHTQGKIIRGKIVFE